MRAVFIGPPGSGKGTQADLLHSRLGAAIIGTGEILRDEMSRHTPLGSQAKSYIDSGRLAPDDLVNAVVAERLRRADRPAAFILDGYPRNSNQAAALDRVLKEQKLKLTAVIHFLIDEDVVVRRMLARQRSDDDEEVIRNRMKEFRESVRDLVNYYRKQGILHEVQADADKERLYVTIASLLLSSKR